MLESIKKATKRVLHKRQGQETSGNDSGLYPPAVNSSRNSSPLSLTKRFFDGPKTGTANSGTGKINQATQPPEASTDLAVPTNPRFASDSASTYPTTHALAGGIAAATGMTTATVTATDKANHVDITVAPPEDAVKQPFPPETSTKNDGEALNDPDSTTATATNVGITVTSSEDAVKQPFPPEANTKNDGGAVDDPDSTTATKTNAENPVNPPENTVTQPETSTQKGLPSLWERALNDPDLSMQERQTLQGVELELQPTTKTSEVAEAFGNFMKDMLDKRQRKGRFTEVCNKIISWVDRFKQIGDIIIQYDPVHAALPWAGFRFLLQICVDKNKTMEAILIGLDKMIFLIDQCSLYERLYLHHNTEASIELEINMVRLYTAILKFLANAIDRSNDNYIQAVFTLDDVSQHLQKVEAIEKMVERYAQIAENQDTRTELQDLKALLRELKLTNLSLQPQLKAIQQHLEQFRRSTILKWISEIPYTEHHERISHDRLKGTVEWLFERQEYFDWRDSDTSKLLLLAGIPGAGKTYIASTVIDNYLQHTQRLAYFYCNQAEEDRQDPQKILATILQQLSQTESKEDLLMLVVKCYEDREAKGQTSAKLSLAMIQDLLIQLIDLYPETTICIDAIDEVNNQTRVVLLEALKDIINHSKSVIKIFITTRMNVDILQEFKIFPLIELQPNDNVTDINHFIETKVQSFLRKKSWDNEVIGDELRRKICGALKIRCKGNFQLASLQIQLFRQLDFKEDIVEALQKLPDTLFKAYDEIYQNICSKPSRSSRLALNAFRWLRCSYMQLNSEELLNVVNANLRSTGEFCTISTLITAQTLLAVCQNLVILDKRLNVFRFAHLSVEEYLETKLSKEDSELEIASICLGILCTDRDDTYWDTWLRDSPSDDLYEPGVDEATKRKHFLLFYAHAYWPWHLYRRKPITADGHLISLLWDKFCGADSKSDKDTYISRAARFFNLALRTMKVAYVDRRTSFYKRNITFETSNNSFNTNEWTLICVCTFRLLQVLQAVIKVPVDAEIRQCTLDMLLLKSSKFGDLEIAQLLIDKGANVSATNNHGNTPLHEASTGGRKDAAQLLIDKGANVDVTNEDGDTPLHLASTQKYLDMVQLLIDKGADVAATNKHGNTPLHRASMWGHTNVVQVLIDKGANMCATDGNGDTPLHNASLWGRTDVVQLFIDKGANVSATNKIGNTPLHLASKYGCENAVQLFINKGANVFVANNNGDLPLHLASEWGRTDVAQLLIDQGANVSVINNNGDTPLHLAPRHDMFWKKDLIQLLIDKGANVSATNENGDTPLHPASQRGCKDAVQMFIDKGASVSAANANGDTPLHLALSSAKNEVAQVLIEQEADISAKNTKGDTPLDLARRAGCDKIVELLINKGAISSN